MDVYDVRLLNKKGNGDRSILYVCFYLLYMIFIIVSYSSSSKSSSVIKMMVDIVNLLIKKFFDHFLNIYIYSIFKYKLDQGYTNIPCYIKLKFSFIYIVLYIKYNKT